MQHRKESEEAASLDVLCLFFEWEFLQMNIELIVIECW